MNISRHTRPSTPRFRVLPGSGLTIRICMRCTWIDKCATRYSAKRCLLLPLLLQIESTPLPASLCVLLGPVSCVCVYVCLCVCALPTEYVGYLSGCLCRRSKLRVGVICFLNFAASKKNEKQDESCSGWIRSTLANLSHCVRATLGLFLAMESRSISLAYLSNNMRQFSTKFGMSNIFADAVRYTHAGAGEFKLKH